MVVISLYNLQRSESRDKHREIKGKGKEVLGARETRLSRQKLPFPFFWNACHVGFVLWNIKLPVMLPGIISVICCFITEEAH